MTPTRHLGAAIALCCAASAASGATITVTSSSDTGSAGICTLRDAITAANNNAAVNGCVAGAASPTVDVSSLRSRRRTVA